MNKTAKVMDLHHSGAEGLQGERGPEEGLGEFMNH